MSTWIVGDIHGAFRTLESLLRRIDYPSSGNQLLLIGDLVNRGPRSLEVMQWAMGQGERITSLIGNHDLYYLARGLGCSRPRKRDTLGPLLESAESEAILDWMRRCPLLVQLGPRRHAVHAGIHPSWELEEALLRAREAEAMLRSGLAPGLLNRMFAKPTLRPKIGQAQVVESLRVLVTIRTCKKNGTLSGFAGMLEDIPPNCFPWFDHPQGRPWNSHFFFGHWAALGLHRTQRVTALDSGCGWERELTAVHLETGKLVSQEYCD